MKVNMPPIRGSALPAMVLALLCFAAAPGLAQTVPPEEMRQKPLRDVLTPKPGAAAGKVGPAAPSVVVLPPRFLSAASPQVRAAAELACDRLAQEIAAAGLARVVDRQQVDRLLRERDLAAEPLRPMLSFDAMLRLEVDAPALVPTARVRLVDLSHGNLLSEAEYDWPLGEEHVLALVEQCRDGLKQVGRPKDGKLRVRCFDVENPEQNPRIAPLVLRLGQVFEHAVDRSPRLVRVRHFEAATAKEESLLLLMGLSRLPGGRQFAPQADATIGLGLREGDGVGKTFEQTPVEITVDIAAAAAEEVQSLVVGGTVEEFDEAITRAWEKVADVLREAQPAAAAEWLGEMAVRRRQAEAELRAARAIYREDPGTRDPQKLAARLAHAETALKLDPTFEDAALDHVEALANCNRPRAKSSHARRDLLERVLNHAVRHFEQFGPEAEHRNKVHEVCRIAIHVSLGGLYFWGGIELTPQRLRMIRMAKSILEDSVEHRGHSLGSDYQAMTLTIVGRAMAQTGVPQDERQRWIDSILEQCARTEEKAVNLDARALRSTQRVFNKLWLQAAVLAAEDGNVDRAKSLVAALQDRLAATAESPRGEIFRDLRGVVVSMDDAAAVNRFDHWRENWYTGVVQVMPLRWPAVRVFPDTQCWANPGVSTGSDGASLRPRIEGTSIRYRPAYFAPITPLVEGEGRLYVAIADGSARLPATLPLDHSGRPVAEPYHDAGGRKHWMTAVTLLPQPEEARSLVIDAATYLAGKLYLGTRRDGLIVFDTKTETWSRVGPQNGLPAHGVVAMHPLDEQTLLCIGASTHGYSASYTLGLPTGKVTLLHRADDTTRSPAPMLFWRDGEALRAWSRGGLFEDLLAGDVKFTPRGRGIPYGWRHPGGRARFGQSSGFTHFAQVGDRRFVTNAGLHEFDPAGNIIRSWWRAGRYEDNYGRHFTLPLPRDCPIESDRMVATGDLLIFAAYSSVLAWDPKTDTWYGPLAVTHQNRPLGTRAGVWLQGIGGLLFLSNDHLIATAKAAGRAMTTDEYRQRQRAVIAAMPPLDRAKVAYSMRQFDTAKELAQMALDDDPECAEALLLMGYLHDVWAMNRPETALQYYQRMTDQESNRNASLTGMYRRLLLQGSQERWLEALETNKEITSTFPRLDDPFQQLMGEWRKYLQEQLAEAAVKQPAGETSNIEERPGN